MQEITNFVEANRRLLSYVPPSLADRKYSLETMNALMKLLDNPQDKVRVVHVAGTSGKTSTAYYVAALLHASGKRVGLTVSPHIDEINERVQIDMLSMPESKFCKQLQIFLDLIDKSDLKPSYFEVLVAFAYWVFVEEEVDYAVVEVGLGGLLDGTNVVSRSDKVAVITDIGLDHTHILGNTLPEISKQKAGIILPGNHVFMHQQDQEIMSIIEAVCRDKKAVLSIATDEAPEVLPLFQRRNWSLAKSAVEYLIGNITQAAIDESAKTVIPARMEVVKHGGKIIIVDGSHNEQKLKALSESLLQKFPDQPIAALVSFGHNKEATIVDSLRVLENLTTHIIFTKFQMGQDEYRTALDPSYLKKICLADGFSDTDIQVDTKEAFKDLLKRPEKILLVTGSFYLLNHIRPLLKTSF